MRLTTVSRFVFSACTCAFALSPVAICAATDFAGPAGWTKTDVPSPTPARTISQWQFAGDTSTSLTFIADSTASYADTLAAMAKNFSDNAIRLGTNKDVPCRGGIAHQVEFTAGPDGSRTVFNRLVISAGTGIATITYTRADGNAFDGDVRKAEAAYCAGTPDSAPPAGAPVPAPTGT